MRQAAGIRCSIALAAAWITAASAAAPAQVASPRPATGPTAVAPAASAPSTALVDACPAQLPVKQTISSPIADWTPMNQDGTYPFVRVAFYPGPPGETSLIVPTVEYKGQSGLHDGWDLPHRAGGYWMTCSYGNTTATLSRKLADDVDFCQADYDGRFFTLVVRHWSCGVKRLMAPPVWSRPATRPGQKPPARPPVKRGG